MQTGKKRRSAAAWTFLGLVALAVLAAGAGCNQSEEPLVDLALIDPTIAVELRYAGTDNFAGKAFYGMQRCYLRLSVAYRLALAQEELRSRGVGLKVWDAYRPLSVQKALWRAAPDREYVARPGFRARHPRGAAVDVTLVYPDGTAVEMPTDFDDFSPAASRTHRRHSLKTRQNLDILERAMRRAGFLPLGSEWWHYDDPDWAGYPPLDIALEDVGQAFPTDQLLEPVHPQKP